jgi:F-type H+-transporting ATPase subunit beta
MNKTGSVTSINGNIVEVAFYTDPPAIHDLLVLEDDPKVQMEVYSSSTESTFFCLLLSSGQKLRKGSTIVNTGMPITIPVGNELLGRVVNIFGAAQDGKGDVQTKEKSSLFGKEMSIESVFLKTS